MTLSSSADRRRRGHSSKVYHQAKSMSSVDVDYALVETLTGVLLKECFQPM